MSVDSRGYGPQYFAKGTRVPIDLYEKKTLSGIGMAVYTVVQFLLYELLNFKRVTDRPAISNQSVNQSTSVIYSHAPDARYFR